MSEGLPSSFYYDTNALRDIRQQGGKSAQSSDNELRQVAKQFEGVFTKMMLKSMRDASFSDTLFNSNKTEFYREMFDKQITQDNAGGMGLADVLYRQLKQTQDSVKNFANPVKSQGEATNNTNDKKAVVTQPAKFMPLDPSRVSPQWRTDAEPAAPAKPKGNFRYSVSIEKEPDFSSVTKENFAFLEKQSQLYGYGPSAGALGGVFSTDKRNTVWNSPAQFVRDVWPHAQRTAQKMNIDPRVLVAQAALETGWGQQVPKNRDGSLSFNLFGIKADSRWSGPSVSAQTIEYRQGQQQRQVDHFRSYPSLGQAFENYADFIASNERYKGAMSVSHSPERYLKELQKAGYATDPQYANKITRILNGPRLNDLLNPVAKSAFAKAG